jgi:hypothetical protein
MRKKSDSQKPKPWPYVAVPDWSRYQKRLEKLLQLGGASPSELRFAPAFVPTLHVRYNWTPYWAEDRRRIRERSGADAFRETRHLEIDAFPIHVGETMALFPPPRRSRRGSKLL